MKILDPCGANSKIQITNNKQISKFNDRIVWKNIVAVQLL